MLRIDRLLRILFFFSAVIAHPLWAQAASPDIYRDVRIGIMVQGRGKALYSWFGHAGIVLAGPPEKLKAVAQQNRHYFEHADQYTGQELLFDYGNFDIAGKSFLYSFLKRELSYYKYYKDFTHYMEANAAGEKRGIEIYWLNLDDTVKQRFAQILFRETSPDFRLYKYDFYFDNCLTRIRDQLNEVFDGRLADQLSEQSPWSLRQILRREIGDKFWVLLLAEYFQGAKIDQKYSRWDTLFLPSYMPEFLEQLRIPADNQALLAEKETVFPFRKEELATIHTYKFFRRSIWLLLLYGSVVLLLALYYWQRRSIFPAVNSAAPGINVSLRSLSYFVLVAVSSSAMAIFSGVLWLEHVLQVYDVALENVSVVLGSPFLALQIPVLLLLPVRPWRRTLLRFFLWNFRIHAWLGLLLPLFSWLYSLVSSQFAQDILLPWLLLLPILAAAAFLPCDAKGFLSKLDRASSQKYRSRNIKRGTLKKENLK